MENASKALIIAGAILLSILLISLGIMIFNQAQDTINNSGMSQAEKSAFNQKFIKYEGDNQKGSVVKSLLQEVIATNSDPNNATRQITIYTITTSGATGAPSSPTKMTTITTNWVSNTSYYKIDISGYTDGVVSAIDITKK